MKINRKMLALSAVCVMVLGATAGSCDDNGSTSKGAAKENAARGSNYERLVASQPAHTVKHSPGRDTKNAWIDAWGQEAGKLAYVYLRTGDSWGYYVLVGPPVSYCDSLVPPYTKTGMNTDQSGQSQAIVPAPGMDGLYHSASNCNVYYGIDGLSGKYVEFSVGMNQSYVMFDQPSTLPVYKDAQQMAPTSIAEAKKKTG